MSGFILTVIIAVLIGWIGDSLTKNNMPGGFWGATVGGLVGTWIGAYMPLFSTTGPKLWDISLIPAVLGGTLFIVIMGLFSNRARSYR